MKKLLIILSILLLVLSPVYSAIITGEVEYNAETAEAEVFSKPFNIVDYSKIKKHLIDVNLTENLFYLLEGKNNLNDRKIANFSDGTYGIMFYDDPQYSWYYQNNGRLISFTYKDSESYPTRITRFKPDGSIINTGLKVSESESFIYNPDGRLLAHWIGNNCYDEYNNLIMKRKYN